MHSGRKSYGCLMTRFHSSRVISGHPDFELLSKIANEVRRRVGSNLESALGLIAMSAVEFVLDPVKTGRTIVDDLDKIEKTFIGLKIEHYLRDILDAPQGVRDLQLLGHDVDVKNTVRDRGTWMIPPESIRDEGICLLVSSSPRRRKSSLGLILAKASYLNKPNRDQKCSIKSSAFSDILWLAQEVDWPANIWESIDMKRFRELRSLKVSGAARAAAFFRENLNKPIHRNVVLSLLHEQKDAMKRLRSNNGAKDLLRLEGIALLSGTYFNGTLSLLKLPMIDTHEFIAVEPEDEQSLTILRAIGELP